MATADPPGRSDAPDSGAVIILHEPHARVRSRRAVQASFFVFSLIAAALVAGFGTASAWSWILLGGAAIVGSRLLYLDDLRWRVREVEPYRFIRRHLVITPESVGFRDAHRPLTLHLDGHPVPLGPTTRLDLTRSRDHYHVSLVLDREVLTLDSLAEHEAAVARARELAALLGLTSPPAEQPAATWEVSEAGEARLRLTTFLAMTSLVGVVCWFSRADISDYVALPLALAAVVLGALFATARQFCLRRLRAEAAQHARAVHHLPSTEAVWTRAEFRMTDESRIGALGSLAAVAMAIAGWLASPTLLLGSIERDWSSEAPHVCCIDVDGDGVPEAIGHPGKADPEVNFGLAAFDAKSGASKEPLLNDDASNLLSCEAPFLKFKSTVAMTSINDTDLCAFRTLVESNNSIWRVTLRGGVEEHVRSQGCVLVRTPYREGREDEWHSISLATGGQCTTIPEPVSPAAIDAARWEQQHRGPAPGVRTAGDITYSLTGSPGLTLAAWRGETLLWATALPARPIDELPLAVAGSTVVVGANDIRLGKYLRILGVDAATGAIRYVRHHPRDPDARVDLAAAGAMVFVEAGRLAGIEAASGKIAWITNE